MDVVVFGCVFVIDHNILGWGLQEGGGCKKINTVTYLK
jgi:hypothetical protein